MARYHAPATISWASLRYYHAGPRYRARGTISRPANDIAHTHDIVSVRGDIRSRLTISRVTPTITRVGTISRRDHDIVGLCTISPRGPRHRKYPQYHSLSRDIGTGARYRRPPTISCASYDIANRPTKSRILTISRPPRQYRTNRRVVMGRRRVNGRSTIRRRRGLFGRRSRTYRCVGRNTLPPGVGVGPRGGVPLPVRRSRETVICLLS